MRTKWASAEDGSWHKVVSPPEWPAVIIIIIILQWARDKDVSKEELKDGGIWLRFRQSHVPEGPAVAWRAQGNVDGGSRPGRRPWTA